MFSSPDGESRRFPESSGVADPAREASGRIGHIRSFVLRQGRVSKAQQRYRDEMMGRVGIPYAQSPLDFDAVFGRSAPRILEIGFGMGESLAAIAKANPRNDYVGVEVHTPGVGSLCKLIAEEGLANLRIIQHDAVEVLRDMIPEQSLDGIHVFFPDPWPKARHHKRRLIQPPFVALLAARLKTGGYVHLATDWENYAEQMLDALSAESSLANAADGYAPRPARRPPTKFEQRGLRLGHGVWDLIFTRPPSSTEDRRRRTEDRALAALAL
jgi:tRNA (guanine-N7-)-methyltransferase